MIRLLFLGSGKFPVPIFAKLLNSKHINVVGLVTSLAEKELTKLAETNNVSVFRSKKISNEQDEILKRTNPDIILVCSFGQILNKAILEYPRFKCLNVHASLLPELRGACPIEMAIIRGLIKTGLSIQLMEQELDTGDIVFQKEISINEIETGGSLTKKIQNITEDNIEAIITGWAQGKIKPKKQDHSKATYCYRKDISKQKARIDWSENAVLIERKIRAFNPRIGAWTMLKSKDQGKRLKIFEAQISKDFDDKPGKTKIERNKLMIQTGKDSIVPTQTQLEGKKQMGTETFLAGFRGSLELR